MNLCSWQGYKSLVKLLVPQLNDNVPDCALFLRPEPEPTIRENILNLTQNKGFCESSF